MFGGDDDDDDPYSKVDITAGLSKQKSSASSLRAREEKKKRDENLKKKREEVERRKNMSEEERVREMREKVRVDSGDVKPVKDSERKGSVFEDYAKGLEGDLEKFRSMGDEDGTKDRRDDTNDSDVNGDTGKTAPVDDMGGTGMVRFGSMENPNLNGMKSPGNNLSIETDDSGVNSFDDFMNDEDSDEEREKELAREAEERERERDAEEKREREVMKERRRVLEQKEATRLEDIKRREMQLKKEKEARAQAERQAKENRLQQQQQQQQREEVTPVQSVRNSVDTTMSTPPPPPDSANTSAPSSSNASPVQSLLASSLQRPPTAPTVNSSVKSIPSSVGTPPPEYSIPGSSSIDAKHNMLRQSVEDNLYKSTESYSRVTSLNSTNTAANKNAPSSNPSSVHVHPASISTAHTLGLAAVQLEMERGLVREQRTRLQMRETDLARARESFEGDVRSSLDRYRAKNAFDGENTANLLKEAEKEKEQMLVEMDDLRSELYEVRRKEAKSATPNMTDAIKEQLAIHGDNVTIPKQDLEKYKKQLEQQETLINGFQKENEKLVAELKKNKEAWAREKGEVLKERDDVNAKRNLAENRLSVDMSQIMKNDYSTTLRATLDAETLQREMEDARSKLKSAEERNLEMKFEMDKMKKIKKEAMLQSEGLSTQQMERSEQEVYLLKELVKKERAVHMEEMDRINSKLNWYIQNQDMVDRDAQILSEQNVVIAKLKFALDKRSDNMDGTLADADNAENQQQRGGMGKKEKDRMQKKIKELEAQVKDLEGDIKRRHPDSISNLIRAMGPSESVEVSRKERNVENKKLKEDMESVRNDGETRMRALRQDYEKMKLGLEQQIKSLKGDVAKNKKELGGGGRASGAGGSVVVGGEGGGGDIEKLRAFYTKKIADAEKKHEGALRAAKRGNVGQPVSPTKGDDRNVNYERVQELEQMISKQKDMISMLEKSNVVRSSQDHKRERDVESKLGIMEGRCRMAETEVQRLKVNLSAAEARLDVTQKLSEEQSRAISSRGMYEARASPERAMDGDTSMVGSMTGGESLHIMPPPPPISSTLHEAEMKQMRVEMEVKRRENEHKINDLQKQVLEAQNTINQFQQQNWKEQQQHMNENNEEKYELMQQQQRLELAAQSAQMNAAMLKNQVDSLKGENLDLSKRLSSMSSGSNISRFGDISSRINEMERRATERQAELENIIKNTREQGKSESRRLQVLFEEELGEKDKQIRYFKRELEELIELYQKEKRVAKIAA